jgi:hypothetical protein
LSAILDLDPVMRFAAHDQLALEALIRGGGSGDAAFRQWIDTVDIENMPNGSTQLLPLMFARFMQGNPHLPHYPRIKGVHRLAHARNSLLLDSARATAGFLAGCGIDVMMIKGSSLALAHYPRPGLRPMGDVDLLVSAADYDHASDVLQQRGWRYRYNEAHRRRVQHSCDYITYNGRALDLHVRGLLEVNDPAFEEGLLARARRMQWAGMDILVPAAENEAMICLVHAMREADAARPLWVMDLAHLTKFQSTIDWHALWKRANRFGVAREVLHALQIASQVRGNEDLRGIMRREIATTPGFESEYLELIITTGSTYSIPESKREEVDQCLSSGRGSAFHNGAKSWSALTETKAAFGTIRVFESESNCIEALYLRWRQLGLVPALFAVTDQDKWDDICRQSPASGEGMLDLPPGVLEWRTGALPPEVYRASIKATSPLPRSLQRSEAIKIPMAVTNCSDGPWYAAAKLPYKTGLSWHVHALSGETVRWDNERTYLHPPVTKEHHFSFVAPGAEITCLLDFTAPEKPGVYRISFALVHEMVRWFADTPDAVHGRFSFDIVRRMLGWFSEPPDAPAVWELTVE